MVRDVYRCHKFICTVHILINITILCCRFVSLWFLWFCEEKEYGIDYCIHTLSHWTNIMDLWSHLCLISFIKSGIMHILYEQKKKSQFMMLLFFFVSPLKEISQICFTSYISYPFKIVNACNRSCICVKCWCFVLSWIITHIWTGIFLSKNLYVASNIFHVARY